MEALARQYSIEQPGELDGFVVTDDYSAEKCLKAIQDESVEAQRYINICETMITEYKFKKEQAMEQLDKKLIWYKERLNSYFETVPKKLTKTQETYKLPSGTLKRKFGGVEYVRDDAKLVEWLKQNEKMSFIKVKETPDWAEFKKCAGIEVCNGNVIDQDGCIVDGVTAVQKEDRFEVEVG